MLNDNQAALVVNGEDVSFIDYQRVHNVVSESMSQQFGGVLPKGMGDIVTNQAINQLIRDTLIRQGASAMGIIVNDNEIRTAIETMPQFQQDGVFSLSLYRKLLASNNLTPGQFEKQMKKDRLLQLTIEKVGDFAAPVGDFEIEDVYSQINEKVAVNYVVFSPEEYERIVIVDDAELSSWYDTEKERYKTAPHYNFRYITFLHEDIGAKIDIDEATLRNYYERHKNSFALPEQRGAAHILIKTSDSDSDEQLAEKRSRAENILQKVRQGGQDFAVLAQEYSEGPSAEAGGDLGTFTRGQMVPSFDETVFSMAEGEISDLVKTQFGFHIVYLNKIIPASEKSFLDAKEEISAALREKEAESMAFQMANSTYEGIIVSGSLESFAQENPDADFKLSGFVTRETAPAEIADDEAFLQQSFALDDKELSSLVKGDSGYAIFYVEEVKDPEIPNLANIVQQVEKDYRQFQAKILAKSAAEAFLAEVEKSEMDFGDAAQKMGLSVEGSGWLRHNTSMNSSTFPAGLVESSFQLSKTTPLAQEVGEANGNYYVYQFVDRKIPVMEKESPERSFYQANLQSMKQQQVFDSWLQSLWIEAKVRRHENL